MLFRPDSDDLGLILLLVGRVLFGVGLLLLVPALSAVAYGETADAWSFVLSAGLSVTVGRSAELVLQPRKPLTASHALAAIALTWVSVPVFGSIPLLLSGHYASWLDAYFEALSGFSTAGLTLVSDLDHMSRSVNLWRHLMQLVGGQAIVVVALTAFSTSAARLGTLHGGEGREEVLLPNIVRTMRFIWRVVVAYGLLGVGLLWLAIVAAGMDVVPALYEASNLFMAAFNTAGFATHSASVAFYRSPLVEAIVLVIMTAGAFSFTLHYQLWQGHRSELVDNTETRTAVLSTCAVLVMMAVGLARTDTFTDFAALYRHGLFHTFSAHTTTGLATVPGRLYLTDWGMLAPGALVAAMGIGGMAGSTAGGIKTIRLALTLKALRADVRRVLLPEDAVQVETFHATFRRVLSTAQVRHAALFLLLWLALYATGAVVGLAYGYPLEVSIFESVAAASTGGLSVGVVRPDLEWPLKIVYMAQIVVGRLEFIAIFALFGYVVGVVRGRV